MKNGQAIITVLFVSVIGLTVTVGALYALLNNTIASTDRELYIIAHAAAESGMENALIRLIRDPLYSGETLELDNSSTAVTTVSGTATKTITSIGEIGTIQQRIQAEVYYNGNVFTIASWTDVP